MKTSNTSHGKVILIGEHSVVYGYDALALPIKALNIKVTVEENDKMWMDTGRYHGEYFASPAEYDGLKYVVKTMLDKAHSKQNLKITYTGEIPIERGLGSSATVALATTRAMDEFFNLGLSEAEIMAVTNHAEMINHGKASGLDAATVNSDCLIFFNKKIGPQKLHAKLGATLLIMDTGELGNTKIAVTQVKKQMDASQAAKDNIDRLGKLASKTKQDWLKQDINAVGENFNQAQDILASFKLSTKRIDQLRKISLANNALGFKLSGSGLGGVVIALCSDSDTARAIANKSQDLIANYWIEEI